MAVVKKISVVLDTNVLVSHAILKHSVAGRAVSKARTNCRILTSAAAVQELQTVLLSPKFDVYVSKSKRRSFIRRLTKLAKPIEIVETIPICRDPKDDKFLELAVNGCADAIVTGDQDLLVLDPFREIRIVTPATFLENW